MRQNLAMLWRSFGDYRKDFSRQLGLLAVVVFVCYGFLGSYISFTCDTPFFLDEYWELGFQQGRWGNGLLALLGFSNVYLPFWNACIGMISFYGAAVFGGMYFYELSSRKLSKESTLVFMLLLVSCPLYYEIVVYPAALINHGFSLMFIFAALFIFTLKEVSWKNCLWSIWFLGWAFATYESFVPVFLLLAVLSCCIQFHYADSPASWNPYRALKLILILLFGALGLYFGGSLLSHVICGFHHGAGREIAWLDHTMSLGKRIPWLIFSTFYDYFYKGLFYFTLLVFDVAVIFWGCCCWKSKTSKTVRILVFLLVMGIIFSLAVLSGKRMPYRIAQTVIVFTSVSWMMFWDRFMLKKYWRFLLLFCVVFWQSKELNIWGFYDYRISQKLVSDIRKIGYDLQQDYGRYPNKDIIICNGHGWNRYDKFIQTVPMQLFSAFPRYPSVNQHAGIVHFNSRGQFRDLFQKLTGVALKEDAEKSKRYGKWATEQKLPAWPQKGYISEQQDCILINLGPKPIDENKTVSPLDFFKSFSKKPGSFNDILKKQ